MSKKFDDKDLEDWVPNPANPDVKSLRGFTLGRSDNDTMYRLYLSSDLNHYLEFCKDDTVHAKKIDEMRTLVWVKADARVREVRSQTTPAEFLQGQVRTGFLRGINNLSGGRVFMTMGCPSSGCGHCTASCSSLPGTPDNTAGFTCNC